MNRVYLQEVLNRLNLLCTMPIEQLKNLLDEFTCTHHIAEFQLGCEDTYQALLDESLPLMVRYERESHSFQLNACLCQLPENPSCNWYEYILERNTSWEDTACGTLHISQDGKSIELSVFKQLENMEFPDFDQLTQAHIRASKMLRKGIRSQKSGGYK